MLPLIAQQLIEVIIVHGVSSLPAAALTEGKNLLLSLLIYKAVRVDIDALRAILRPAYCHQITLLHIAKFHHGHFALPDYSHAVHPAVLCQHPLSADAEIFGEHSGGVIVFRHHTVFLCRDQLHIGRVVQPQSCKIWCLVFGMGETHS